MPTQFKPAILQPEQPAQMPGVQTGYISLASRGGIDTLKNAPGGTESKIGQKIVNRTAALCGLKIRVIENGEGELFAIRPADRRRVRDELGHRHRRESGGPGIDSDRTGREAG